MNFISSIVELDRQIQQLQTQCRQHSALHNLEPQLKRLAHCNQSIHDICHAASLELGQISCALAVTTASPSPCNLRPPRLSIACETGRSGGAGSAPRTIPANLAGTSGKTRSLAPIASATALAMQTGVDMQLPSPTPFDPSGVKGEGVSM